MGVTATKFNDKGLWDSYVSLKEEEVQELADMLLTEITEYPYFMKPGFRNDHTVNLLICCAIKGYVPDELVRDAIISKQRRSQEQDWSSYLEHQKRIEPYLETWCPKGSEYLGYNYIVYDPIVKKVHMKYFGKEN